MVNKSCYITRLISIIIIIKHGFVRNSDFYFFLFFCLDRTNGNLYGIKALDLKQSGPSHPASHRLTPEELQLITTNLMTALGVFIVVALLAAAFYVYKKKRYF